VTEQKKLLVNQNHIKNQPMPVDFFARTEHKNKCNYCRFRKVCGELENYEKKTARLF
jgi:CRISPR/Cas system-associated exonuclease Cas4 (RecB family)